MDGDDADESKFEDRVQRRENDVGVNLSKITFFSRCRCTKTYSEYLQYAFSGGTCTKVR